MCGNGGIDGGGGSGLFRSGGGGLCSNVFLYAGSWYLCVGWGFCGGDSQSETSGGIYCEYSLVLFECEGIFPLVTF